MSDCGHVFHCNACSACVCDDCAGYCDRCGHTTLCEDCTLQHDIGNHGKLKVSASPIQRLVDEVHIRPEIKERLNILLAELGLSSTETEDEELLRKPNITDKIQ